VAIDALRLPATRATRLAGLRVRFGLIGLGGIVAASVAVRTAVALAWQWTPRFFPDEYIYGTLARSLAENRALEIRGNPAHFPALLEPLLASPFWLVGDPATAYRLTLVMHAVAMSLAAVPVYLLARRLELGERVALVAAGLAVASPALMYANWLTADAIAYPLALGTLALYVRVLSDPSRALQVAAVGLTAATVLARMQFVVLPVVFVLAAIVVEQGSIRAVARRFRVTLGLFLAPVLGAAAIGPSRVLGYYGSVTDRTIDVAGIAHWVGLDATLVALSICVLAPGAVAGVAAGLIRPRKRAEAAFAAITAFFAAGLLLEAGLYATGGSGRFQERYLIALAPLAAPAFALSLGRGKRTRGLAALVAAGLLVFALRVPLSGYVFGSGKQDSPFLGAVSRLEDAVGIGTAGLLVSLAVGVLCAVAALAAFRRGAWTHAALGLALAASTGLSVGAVLHDRSPSENTRRTYLPADASWVDHAGVGPVDALLVSGTPRGMVSEHLLWNRSIERVLVLPGAVAPDAFGSVHLRVAADGRLLDRGKPVRRSILVEDYASTTALANARRVRKTVNTTLWRPRGDARLSTLTLGRYFDGWLASDSSITIWPDATGNVEGALRLRLSHPDDVPGTAVERRAPAGFHRRVAVGRGGDVTLAIPVHASGRRILHVRATALRFLHDSRNVSVKAAPPVFERAPLKASPAAADRS
jgi:hypothetical protein